jgi:hypothetical protein
MTEIAPLDKPNSYTANFVHIEVRLGVMRQTADAASEKGFARTPPMAKN